MNTHALFLDHLEKYGPNEGVNLTAFDKMIVVRESESHSKIRDVYEPFLLVVGKGKKSCYVGEQRYEYGAGNGLTVLLPMPVQTEIIGATPDDPFLAAVIALDLDKMSDMLLRIERVEPFPTQKSADSSSGISSISMTDDLLGPIVRLFESLDTKRDTAILSDLILEEIYYRLLCHDQGAAVHALLHHRGHMQRITRAVDYIHENVDKPVSVEALAEMVHMSRATFYEQFKATMHVSPLQYAKSVKLFQARRFIYEGKNASEAGYLVGYNSPAQFSREYKRHFGYTPSATTMAV